MNSAISIYEMKARAEMRQVDFADVFSAMVSVAKIQSLKSSNAIEGVVMTDKRITIFNGTLRLSDFRCHRTKNDGRKNYG